MQKFSKVKKMPYSTVEERKKVYEFLLGEVELPVNNFPIGCPYICEKLGVVMQGLAFVRTMGYSDDAIRRAFPEFASSLETQKAKTYFYSALPDNESRREVLERAIKLCGK